MKLMDFLDGKVPTVKVHPKVLCVPCRLNIPVSGFPVKCPQCGRVYVTTTGEELAIVKENTVS